MPRPPNWDSLIDWRFVTNYALLGCSPPQWLVLDYAGPPAKELLMLFLLPDLTDIAQAVFDPRVQRKRKPARHGKKKPKKGGLPDISDIIGGKARAHLNPHNGINIKPFRVAFRIFNAYEAVQISAAIVDGMTDVVAENVYGIIKMSDAECYDFKRISKTKDGTQTIGGTGPPIWPVGVTEIEFNNGFFEGPFGTQCNQPYSANFQVTVYNHQTNDIEVAATLGDSSTTPKYQATIQTCAPGDTVTSVVSGDFDANEFAGFGCICDGDQGIVMSASFLGFSISDWPWPW